MDKFKNIIDVEESRFTGMVSEMRSVIEQESKARTEQNREIADLKEKKLNSLDWKEKEEYENLLNSARGRMASRNYQDPKILRKPYFGVLELSDDDLGELSYCIGNDTFFGLHGQVLVIDWRNAPISKLYYEYDSGEDYDEDIRGRERSGFIQSKRQVEISNGILRTITDSDTLLSKDTDNNWQNMNKTGSTSERKEMKEDHRLPEITALISRDQFQAITLGHSRTFLLQGGAGSGKTTVGLHRIAYLTYHDKIRFTPQRILVVMFNKALQTYISGVLPDLGVGAGVHVRTYHNWAGNIIKACGMKVIYTRGSAPEQCVKFKKSALPLTLVDRYLDTLLKKSKEWLLTKLSEQNDSNLGKIRAVIDSSESIERLIRVLSSNVFFERGKVPEKRAFLGEQLLKRLSDHGTDLCNALTDDMVLQEIIEEQDTFKPGIIPQLINWQNNLKQKGEIDFSDTGILLYLLQGKGIPAAQPDYAHIMVDEAQDFSAVELATMIMAADEDQSITICGDMAQKIKGDVAFENNKGFAGFVKKLQEKKGVSNLSAETLSIGYRATSQIMDIACHVLGTPPAIEAPRDGEPVKFLLKKSPTETSSAIAEELKSYMQKRPRALVGVICKFKSHTDQVFEELRNLGVPGIRRHQRNDFSFKPGIIVTNAHQVKGLEFSAVVAVNPSVSQYQNNAEDRMLLHVVLTRASEKLWIACHEKPAYGMDIYAAGIQNK